MSLKNSGHHNMNSAATKNRNRFGRSVNEQEKRKLYTQRRAKKSVWSGLGLFGIIGWSVAIPTLLGAALGKWMDHHHAQAFSWTLTFLIVGLIAGCLVAWQWVSKENNDMHKDKNEHDK